MAAGDTPAEPDDAGSGTVKTQPPIWPTDYDLSDQPNQAADEPPTVPEEEPEGLLAAGRPAPLTPKEKAAKVQEGILDTKAVKDADK